jgi:hypothetical protein
VPTDSWSSWAALLVPQQAGVGRLDIGAFLGKTQFTFNLKLFRLQMLSVRVFHLGQMGMFH